MDSVWIYIQNIVLLFLFCINQLLGLPTVGSFNFVLFIIKHHCQSRDSRRLLSLNMYLGICTWHFYCAIGLQRALPRDCLEYINSNVAAVMSLMWEILFTCFRNNSHVNTAIALGEQSLWLCLVFILPAHV